MAGGGWCARGFHVGGHASPPALRHAVWDPQSSSQNSTCAEMAQ
jgi:hypothetical protein